MSSVVIELENALQAMAAMRAPGVSGSKITLITDLSVNHVQSESIIIQKVYIHFKKCPGTHKLGTLYVVDSIVRKYIEYAKKHHQDVSPAAPDGTYGAGVHRITNLLPALMSDILQHAPPEENKDKIEKLVAIWERASTFPPDVLADIKKKIAASPMFQIQIPEQSTTPSGTPPPHLQDQMPPLSQPTQVQQPQVQSAQSNASNTASILQALAQMAKQNQITSAPVAPPLQATAPAVPAQRFEMPNTQQNGFSGMPSNFGSFATSQLPATVTQAPPVSMSYTPTPPNANSNAAPPSFGNQINGAYATPQSGQTQAQAQFSQFPVQQSQPVVVPTDQMALLQMILQHPNVQGLSLEQMGQAFGALSGNGQNAQGNNGSGAVPTWQHMMGNAQVPQASVNPPTGNELYDRGREQHNRGNYSPPPRSRSPPRFGRRGRSRSRSPACFERSPPRTRRRSPVYGEYPGNDNRGSRENGRSRGRGRGGRGGGSSSGGGGSGSGGSFERRSSPRNRKDRSKTPQGGFANGRDSQGRGDGRAMHNDPDLPKVQKYLDFDPSIGENNIKVFSRTLFVGGVTIPEDDLRLLFEQHGRVQSCIVNKDKRHAFIKMLTREDAINAREGMETYRADGMTIRTRWGVGFGPRDCSDYQTGISIIPIDRLTDADQRWMMSAEYGGTGGQPLKGGLSVEEPDIEIGQGVSSKAISKRFPTDSGGAKGPRSSHDTNHREHRGKHHFNEGNARGGPPRDNVGVAPPTPGFGSGFPFSMPMMPPNFQFPGFPGQQSS